MRNRATTPLSKAKLRMSLSKYNLYNLSRIVTPSTISLNFFQQKWKSKSALRDYHGEQVRERQWQKMFSKRIQSVVPMNPAYLAVNDGSAESAGRGSGLDMGKKAPVQIPYMQMTFAPLERRLDIAIFRAMFASSARQARQFVVHGAVKVNGQKMRYPGYLLNPGDMFQVDPARVMYAMGQPKALIETKSADEGEESEVAEAEKPAEESVTEAEIEEVDIDQDPREVLKDMLAQSKSILASPKENIGAKRKQDLRAFSLAVKRTLSRSKSDTIHTDSLEAQFLELQNQLNIQRQNKKSARTALPSEQKESSQEAEAVDVNTENAKQSTEANESQTQSSPPPTTTPANTITDSEYNELFAALQSMSENPIDDSKPYSTPWMPRDYISAFAFIPRYLEVNQNICSAVYLRHPVARPGSAEVPTPFAETTSGNAFAWYLRRR